MKEKKRPNKDLVMEKIEEEEGTVNASISTKRTAKTNNNSVSKKKPLFKDRSPVRQSQNLTSKTGLSKLDKNKVVEEVKAPVTVVVVKETENAKEDAVVLMEKEISPIVRK